MRQERGLSERTIEGRICILKNFFSNFGENRSLQQLNIVDIDKILEKRQRIDRCCRRTIQTYASVLRAFLTYAEGMNLCKRGLAKSIKLARVYRHETLPCGPSWDDVQKLLAGTNGNDPRNIRDRAIVMLLAIYGLRSSEVVKLRLEDLDWENEVLYVRRAKDANPQQFPLTQTVGNTILIYLKNVRPHQCHHREVFITLRAPYRPLSTAAIFRTVNELLKPLNIPLKHHGPHALRHACATHLINEGITLKEISDYLGHRSVESTRIYAKVDLTNLRKVANFEIRDLL